MDPSCTGPRTRSQSQPPPPPAPARAGSPKTSPYTPWTDVVKTRTKTPIALARAPTNPAHPFEDANQFDPLRPTHDDSDDGSGHSGDILLTPPDLPPPPAAAKSSPGPRPKRRSRSSLEDLIRANATGIAELRALVTASTASITNLTRTVESTSSQLSALATELNDVRATAEQGLSLASTAQPSIEGQRVRLHDVADDVIRLKTDITDLRASMAIPPDVDAMVSKIKAGEGTIGKFFKDEEVFEDMREFVRELKRRPWRIIWKE